MITKRIIACLDVRDGRVVKGVQFQGLRDAGSPPELASAIAREMKLSKKLVRMLLLFGILRDPDLVESPYPEAKTAIQYNRRLKGSGYQQKLAGDNILLEARIMAVADMFETISSPRPYHPAIGLDQALEEFSRSKSALYAADVVQALIRLVKQGNFKFRTQYS